MMMNSETAIDLINNLARQQTFVTRQELIRAGIDESTLAMLIEKYYLIAEDEGLYTLLDSKQGKHHTRVLASHKIPEGVICLETALSFHELTPLIPTKVNLALPAGYNTPRSTNLPIRTTSMPQSIYEDGIDIYHHENQELKVYNIPKTIVDCFAYPWSVGMDFALKALAESLSKKLCTVEEIKAYATKANLQSDIKKGLEKALENPEEIHLYT